jgi:hypothetical protein
VFTIYVQVQAIREQFTDLGCIVVRSDDQQAKALGKMYIVASLIYIAQVQSW